MSHQETALLFFIIALLVDRDDWPDWAPKVAWLFVAINAALALWGRFE